jgi:hypothetical protein
MGAGRGRVNALPMFDRERAPDRRMYPAVTYQAAPGIARGLARSLQLEAKPMLDGYAVATSREGHRSKAVQDDCGA